MKDWGSVLGIGAGLLVGFLAAETSSAATVAPERLRDLDGRPARIEDHRGSIVVLNFWATWCVPCREEMPLLSDIQDRFGPRGVRVIGLSTDEPGREAAVRRFVRQYNIDFPIWIGGTTEDMERMGVGTALPASAILDRDGRIVFRMLGLLRRDDLETRIEWLLGDRIGPPPADRVDNFPAAHEHPPGETHDAHAEEEDHAHGNVAMEGASLVPS